MKVIGADHWLYAALSCELAKKTAQDRREIMKRLQPSHVAYAERDIKFWDDETNFCLERAAQAELRRGDDLYPR